jgi:hypothetical protein
MTERVLLLTPTRQTAAALSPVFIVSPSRIAGTRSDVRDINLSSATVNAYFCAFIRQCQDNRAPTRKSDAPSPSAAREVNSSIRPRGLIGGCGGCAPTLMRRRVRFDFGTLLLFARL